MEKKLIDDAFYVERQRWGTWDSFTVDGKPILTSPSEEACVHATRFYLKGLQEGWSEDNSIKYDGVVGGKL